MAEVTKLVDVTRCVGCRGCVVACKEWYDLPGEWQGARFEGSYQHAGGSLGYNRWVNVQFYEVARDDGQPPTWFFRKHQCLHCGEPPCVAVCPVDALERTESGAVNLDQDVCIGCRYCESACPFGVPKYSAAERKVSKCILCYDRITNGMEPICVKTCPTGALVFGEREQVLAEAKARLEAVRDEFPDAQIYDPPGVGGTRVVYLLPGPPEAYGLPANPRVPASVTVWQSVTKPVGGVAVGASLAASVVAFVIQRRMNGSGDDGKRNEV
ncbi:4Fe-4S dicluster domain-containing protein [Caldinitratiruptor microaerophilus]|uniref:Formate dehydrogenase iron-sulfur subunit n=1 Tax=Caldinitratiruptor microaerophilus TaxID=671077 RepID=A0AA35GAD3_9FIRM|nr:4Fe-4S dicluster domain-containing protein [Caldinitratiruptor microaerophilus]BDG61174.1 formate dehydrogenase iron-sulfur subunit [Caldinitratiruptor microaerophilus]